MLKVADEHHHGHAHAGHHHGPASHDHHHADEGAAAAGALSWRVGGMDCGSCAATIRTALEKMPGTGDIRISTTTETLSLRLSDGTTADSVTSLLAKLGYWPSVIDEASPAGRAADAAPLRWHQTAKGRTAIAAGLLLAAAFVIDFFWPAAGPYVFAAATLTAALPISRRAFAAAAAGAPFTIEMLMTIAAAGALVIGAQEEAAVVVFLFAVGEVLEGVAAAKAREGIKSLSALIPKTALVEDEGGIVEIQAELLKIGQTVSVRPGDRVPADGVVIEGKSGVDESPVTGESVPRLKEPGSAVFAGSVNCEGALRVRVTKSAENNTIARIVKLVEEAQDAKAPTERFIDRFSRVYMPVIVGLSALVAIVPPLLGFGAWNTWIYRGLTLLLIGCPCALVISVPAAIAACLSAAARNGLLVKGGAVIEKLAEIKTVVFDKTGTLTRGKPEVTDVIGASLAPAKLLAVADAIERASSHPLAKAISARARRDSVDYVRSSDVKAVPGEGMEGTADGAAVFIGAPRFAALRGSIPAELSEKISALEDQGKTVAVVMRGGEAAGVIALMDEPRPDAADALRRFERNGIGAVMLTGDNRRAAAAVGLRLGIEPRAELMPEGKVAEIRALGAKGPVLMIGDGINDAPALAAAHAGLAMGSGTDVAIEAADAALLNDRVTDAARLVELSRATMANIRQNIAIALGLKLLFLATTIAGITGLWIAVLADTGATVIVTLNALRILAFFSGERKIAAAQAV